MIQKDANGNTKSWTRTMRANDGRSIGRTRSRIIDKNLFGGWRDRLVRQYPHAQPTFTQMIGTFSWDHIAFDKNFHRHIITTIATAGNISRYQRDTWTDKQLNIWFGIVFQQCQIPDVGIEAYCAGGGSVGVDSHVRKTKKCDVSSVIMEV